MKRDRAMERCDSREALIAIRIFEKKMVLLRCLRVEQLYLKSDIARPLDQRGSLP